MSLLHKKGFISNTELLGLICYGTAQYIFSTLMAQYIFLKLNIQLGIKMKDFFFLKEGSCAISFYHRFDCYIFRPALLTNVKVALF